MKKGLPDIKPEKTVEFVHEYLHAVNPENAGQTESEISEWTVKVVVEANICEHWTTNGSLLVCRERILQILNVDYNPSKN